MIISHQHKFIFIKTKKTSGSAIEISLSRYCGHRDILTPIGGQGEAIRRKIGKGPQNHEGYSCHMGAEEIRKRVGEHVWNTYYTFCFERNPWEKVAALYDDVLPKLPKKRFYYFMQRKLYVRAYNFPQYTIQDLQAVHFIGQYATIEQDLTKVCRIIGLPFDGWLPQTSGYRKRVNDNALFTPLYKAEIENYFKKEIELFQYTFKPQAL